MSKRQRIPTWEESILESPPTHERNPIIGTLEYHLSQVLQGISKSLVFHLETYLLSGGGQPPIPPKSPPRTLTGEPEDETEGEGELEEEGRQLIIVNPHPMAKKNTNKQNNQPWLVPDAIVVLEHSMTCPNI
jgi:hypothetical protein